MTLTKDALVELIRDKVGYPVKEAKEILEMILEEIKQKLEDGEDVKISGFGKWTVKQKRSRPGRNPHTGERIEISARKVVTFHPSDKLRDLVNREHVAATQQMQADAAAAASEAEREASAPANPWSPSGSTPFGSSSES